MPNTRWVSYVVCEYFIGRDIGIALDEVFFGENDSSIKGLYKKMFMSSLWPYVHYGTVHIDDVDFVYKDLLENNPSLGKEEIYLDYLEDIQIKIIGYNSSLKSLYSYKTLLRLYKNGDNDALCSICEKASEVVKKAISYYYTFFNNRILVTQDDLYQSIMMEIIKLIQNYSKSFSYSYRRWISSDIIFKRVTYNEEYDFNTLLNCDWWSYYFDEVHHVNRLIATSIKKVLTNSLLWTSDFGIVKEDNESEYLLAIYLYYLDQLPLKIVSTGTISSDQIIDDIARCCDCTKDMAQEYFSEYYFMTHMESLDYFMENNDIGEYEIVSLSGDDSKKVDLIEDEVIANIYKDTLIKAIDTLKERERKVLVLKFGLEDNRERTLEEVGQSFGVTRERIRQTLKKAFSNLKHPKRFYLIDY